MKPLVSIIIPNYNRADLIEETLNSIISQTYTNWECLIIDDDSSDKSEQVVAEYSKKDPRIKFFKRPNTKPKGANACRNYGIDISQGVYVNWVDSDDIFHPEKMSKQVALIENKNCLFSICKSYVFKNHIKEDVLTLKSNKVQSDDAFNDFISKRIIIPVQGPIFKKQFLIDNEFCFDESLQAGQEWEFFARILHKYPKYEVVNEPLDYIREHSNNISNHISNDKYWYYFKARMLLEEKLGELLLPESQDILNRFYLFSFKVFARSGDYSRAQKTWNLKVKHIDKLSSNDKLKLQLGLLTHCLFKKGDSFLSKVSLYNKS